MSDDNKKNLQYFEGASMRELYDNLKDWQEKNSKRLLSVSIQKDNDNFCCIALTNPSEVVIVAKQGNNDNEYGEITAWHEHLNVTQQ